METDEATGQGYKDRRTGLMVFGAGLILLGLLCLVGCLFTVAASLLSRGAAGGGPPDKFMLAASLGLYGGLAVFFLWMGIGSLMGRRWARALTLVVSIYWLIAGALVTLFVIFIVPRVMASALESGGRFNAGSPPRASLFIATVVLVALTAFFMILIPAALVLFYRSPHVKATCERLDPKERWTDRVPLAVLALTVLLAAGGVKVFLLFALPAYPVFGYLLKGPLAAMAYLVMAALLWVLAVGVYRRLRWAWTATLALTLLGFVSGLVSFARIGLEGWLEMVSTGPTPPGMEQVLGTMMPAIGILMAAGMLAWLAFLLYVLRYFKQPTVPAQPVA